MKEINIYTKTTKKELLELFALKKDFTRGDFHYIVKKLSPLEEVIEEIRKEIGLDNEEKEKRDISRGEFGS